MKRNQVLLTILLESFRRTEFACKGYSGETADWWFRGSAAAQELKERLEQSTRQGVD